MAMDKILGGGENVSAEVAEQTPLIQEIMENLVGKVQGANATPDDIFANASAYVGQKLVKGNVPENLRNIRYGIVTFNNEKFTIEHGLGVTPRLFVAVIINKTTKTGSDIKLLSKSNESYMEGYYNPRCIANNFGHDLKDDKDVYVNFDATSFWYKTTAEYGTFLWIAIA